MVFLSLIEFFFPHSCIDMMKKFRGGNYCTVYGRVNLNFSFLAGSIYKAPSMVKEAITVEVSNSQRALILTLNFCRFSDISSCYIF